MRNFNKTLLESLDVLESYTLNEATNEVGKYKIYYANGTMLSDGGVFRLDLEASSLNDLLVKLCNELNLINIEEGMSNKDIIEEIKDADSYGGDYVYLIKNETTGKVYLKQPIHEVEDGELDSEEYEDFMNDPDFAKLVKAGRRASSSAPGKLKITEEDQKLIDLVQSIVPSKLHNGEVSVNFEKAEKTDEGREGPCVGIHYQIKDGNNKWFTYYFYSKDMRLWDLRSIAAYEFEDGVAAEIEKELDQITKEIMDKTGYKTRS